MALAVVMLLAVACAGGREDRPRPSLFETAVWSAVQTDLRADPDHGDLRAFLVYVDGKPVLEKYLHSSAEDYWDVESVTKSVLSTLVGIAIGEGAITGVHATLGRLLPQHRRAMTPETRSITLRELLSMTAGFPPLGEQVVDDGITAADPIDTILSRSNPSRRGTFQYSNEGAHLVGAVLEQATRTPLLDYARSRLFEPLGIQSAPAYTPVVPAAAPTRAGVDAYLRAGFAWPRDHGGLPLGSSLLKLRPGDLVRIGQLYLDGGRWHGRQIVPRSWVRAATTPIARDSSGRGQYGFEWWVGEADGVPAFMAQGYGGQLIEVVPSRRLVVVAATELSYLDDLGQDGISPTTLTFAVSDVVAPAVRR